MMKTFSEIKVEGEARDEVICIEVERTFLSASS